MAIGATIYRFSIALSDVDRGVFESVELRIAQHPSESPLFFVVRALARCLEHDERVELTRGVSDTELPALVIRDMEGRLSDWIEVGLPGHKRVHKATSRCDRVVIYAHKQVPPYIEKLRAAEIRRADRVTVVHFDDEMLDALQDALQRSAQWSITVSDNVLYIEANGAAISGPIHRTKLADVA